MNSHIREPATVYNFKLWPYAETRSAMSELNSDFKDPNSELLIFFSPFVI